MLGVCAGKAGLMPWEAGKGRKVTKARLADSPWARPGPPLPGLDRLLRQDWPEFAGLLTRGWT